MALQLEFAFDAQQFCGVPPLFVAFASLERVVDRFQSFSNPPSTGQALRKRAKRCCAKQGKLSLVQFVNRRAENSRPGIEIAAPDYQHAPETAPHSVKDIRTRASRAIEQCRRDTVRGSEITCKQRHWTRVNQYVA